MKKITAFITALIFALCLSGCQTKSASIGIIGGADGPTAIFVTSKINWLAVCGFIGMIVVAIGLVLIIYRNKKKK